MQLAAARATRIDIGSTASWEYSGQGATIVLVHGFRGDHHGLSAIAGALSEYRVLIPDLPGYGKTPPLESHDLDSYGKWLIDYLDQVGDCVVLGHSFGSLVLANAYSQGLDVNTAVLLNPITTTADQTPGGMLAAAYYRLCRLGLIGSYLMRSALVVRGMSIAMATSWDLKLRSFIHGQHLRYFSSYATDKVVQEGFRAANQGNVIEYQKTLPKNLLLIAGTKDKIAPIQNTRELAQKTRATLKELPVGHLTHYETPFEVGVLVTEFLEGND